MEKIIFIVMFTIVVTAQSNTLEYDCLSCHKAQQIPSNLIYRRYLMKYSTDDRMQKAIFKYLKNPNKATSIMPTQFFLKFPMKKPLSLDDKTLKRDIQNYLKKFDVKKRLILGK